MNNTQGENSAGNTQTDSDDEIGNASTFDFTKKTWRDDVAFVLEGQKLYASKSILALVSPVFECMFGEHFAEKYQHEIPLPGKKFEDFHEFLRCIYPTSHRHITSDNVTKLLPLSDEYQVKRLIKKCDKFLCSHLLSREDIAASYLLHCHEMATRYRMRSVRDICVSILAEKELEDLQEARDFLQDSDSYEQVLSDIVNKQAKDREVTRTELVKLYMNFDTSSNASFSDIIGFEFSKGATIEFRPSVTALLQKQTQFSSPVRLWDLFFQLQLTHYIKHDGDQCMKLKVRCKFPVDGMTRVCETKTKIIIKNHNETPSYKHISHLLTTSYLSTERPYLSYAQNLAPILKNDSGYVRRDKLLIHFHFLANKPYIEGTPREYNQNAPEN